LVLGWFGEGGFVLLVELLHVYAFAATLAEVVDLGAVCNIWIVANGVAVACVGAVDFD
jgi:hypothetical protein